MMIQILATQSKHANAAANMLLTFWFHTADGLRVSLR